MPHLDRGIIYQKLNKIIRRKKTFLPRIIPNSILFPSQPKKKSKINKINNHPLKFQTHSIYEKYVIRRDNEIIYNKLDRIHNRSCQAVDDEAKIQKYLDIKKNTREGIRKINQNLLRESNKKIKSQIYQTKPVLNTLKLKSDFIATRGYYKNLRRLRPSQSVGEIFLTKNESDNIDRYLDIHNPKKNLDSNEYRRQLTNNKRSLKKLGYDIKGIFSFSQGKKI